jgi:aminoglycoside phosphotransferase (APT) family kinase protein
MFMRQPDYHTRRELVARYEAQTGIEYTDDRFYRALGVFKLAALCEGFFRMFLEDSPSTKDSYPLMELMVPTLGRQARQIVDGETPL